MIQSDFPSKPSLKPTLLNSVKLNAACALRNALVFVSDCAWTVRKQSASVQDWLDATIERLEDWMVQ